MSVRHDRSPSPRSGRAGRVAVSVARLRRRGHITTAEWPVSRQLCSSVSGLGVPPPPYRGSSLDQRTCQRRPVGGGQERLGGHLQPQLGAEVHQQQPVVASLRVRTSGAPTPRGRARRRRRPPASWRRNRRVVAAEPQQVAVQRQRLGVRAPRRARPGRASTARTSRGSAGCGSRACIAVGRQAGELPRGTLDGPGASRRPARAGGRRSRGTGSTRRTPAPGRASASPGRAVAAP